MLEYLNEIVCGNCLEVIGRMPDNCIDSIITDPPYGLKFMNKQWDYNIPEKDIWIEALRVAKPGAFLLCFGGTRTYHRLACEIEDAGWELRDCIMWIYGSGFPKSLNIGKAIDKSLGVKQIIVGKEKGMGKQNPEWNGTAQGRAENCFKPEYDKTVATSEQAQLFDGYGTALKPAYEPIIVAMKPLDGTFANNALTHGVAGLNIDGGRIEYSVVDGGNLAKNPQLRKKINGGCGGNIISHEEKRRIVIPNQKGRFPANVIMDEEAGRLLDEQSGVLKSGEINPDKHIHKHKTGSSLSGSKDGSLNTYQGSRHYESDTGGASRFFYCAKASKSDRGEGNNHPTVKPITLMEYLCKLTRTPTGGVVLDPFCGSGTTAIAAALTNRHCVCIDISEEYCKIARQRLASNRG